MVNLSASLMVRGICAAALVGCGTQHTELVAARGKLHGGISSQASQRADDVRIEAANKLWNGAPSDFESYFTPFAIDIDNLGKTSRTVSVTEFYLEDDQGRVASALIPLGTKGAWTRRAPDGQVDEEHFVDNWQRDDFERIAGRTARSKPSAVALPDRLRTGNAPLLGGLSPGTDLGWSWKVNDEWSTRRKGVFFPGLFSYRAIRTHEVAPSDRVVGFVYFPRIQPDTSNVWLTWRRSGEAPIRLPFRVKT